eukprot:scaffold221273_cov20-Cyclotella_meneghiniana.AAC.1
MFHTDSPSTVCIDNQEANSVDCFGIGKAASLWRRIDLNHLISIRFVCCVSSLDSPASRVSLAKPSLGAWPFRWQASL